MIPWKNFASFASTHIPHSYLKSTFEEVWKKEESVLKETSKSRFRNKDNVNHWLMRYWQLASGNFEPQNINVGCNFMLEDNDNRALNAIREQKYKMICLNDTVKVTNFDLLKNQIKDAFDSILPKKSEFEV